MRIEDNLSRVRETIAQAAARAGRNADDVTLVAVSKTHPAKALLAAYALGVKHFGENRVEEAQDKIPIVDAQTNAPLTWHMIGHVQSRKAKDVVPLFSVLHSVDSLKLATRLSRFAVEQARTLEIFLEVNVSGEATKAGFDAARWEADPAVREPFFEAASQIIALPGLRVRGLMTMAPIVEEMQAARPVFASLAGLRASLSESLGVDLPDLSMGMTDDYPVAIEEGSTVVRVGRAIFG